MFSYFKLATDSCHTCQPHTKLNQALNKDFEHHWFISDNSKVQEKCEKPNTELLQYHWHSLEEYHSLTALVSPCAVQTARVAPSSCSKLMKNSQVKALGISPRYWHTSQVWKAPYSYAWDHVSNTELKTRSSFGLFHIYPPLLLFIIILFSR